MHLISHSVPGEQQTQKDGKESHSPCIFINVNGITHILIQVFCYIPIYLYIHTINACLAEI